MPGSVPAFQVQGITQESMYREPRQMQGITLENMYLPNARNYIGKHVSGATVNARLCSGLPSARNYIGKHVSGATANARNYIGKHVSGATVNGRRRHGRIQARLRSDFQMQGITQ